MGNTLIYQRLDKFGLRDAAETYKEEVRKRLGQEQGGKTRDRAAVRQQAEDAMWELFKPVVEQREAEERAECPSLKGIPADTDSVLDKSYSEPNPGAQLRDGLLWAAMEWMRVIRDTEDGPVASINAASTPPPNPFALFVLESYALAGIERRRELITRALAFATKSHDAPQEPQSTTGADPYLEGI
jgi:hypothetical protein